MNPETIAVLSPLILAGVQLLKAASARTTKLPTLRDLPALVVVFITGIVLALIFAVAGVGSIDSLSDLAGSGSIASALAVSGYSVGRVIWRAFDRWLNGPEWADLDGGA